MPVDKDIINILEEFGTRIKEDLQESLRKKGVTYGGNDSKLSNAIKFSVKHSTDVISFKLMMPEYGEAVNDGRGKDKTPPPIAPIENWIKRKGLKPKERESTQKKIKSLKNKTVRKAFKKRTRESDIKSMAIAISKSIGKNGYDGNMFYDVVVNDGRLDKLKKDIGAIIKDDFQLEIIDLTKI